MSEKYIVTWDMLQIHARKLASRLMPSEQWKGIIAVSRGGLVPGALLARELGIRHVDTVCISSYDHDNQRELKVLKRAEGDGEGFIVIDDLGVEFYSIVFHAPDVASPRENADAPGRS